MKPVDSSVEEATKKLLAAAHIEASDHLRWRKTAIAESPPRILLIAGSAQHPSRVRTSLDILAEKLQQLGALPQLWDLYEQPLPLISSQFASAQFAREAQAAQRLAQLAELADAFVLGSPVYHNSFSGVLKNALDSLSTQQFQNKPVALVSSGNSDRTGSQPCDHLRSVVRGLLAVPIPTQLITIPSDFSQSQSSEKTYVLSSEIIDERCNRLAQELIAYAMLLRTLPMFYTEVLAQTMSL
jgi:azobenzene reductase